MQRRSPGATPAPLSSWQQSIWFFDQMEPGRDTYHRAKRLRLKGTLDSVALEKSIAEIFRRHEVLRSRVTIADGRPAQSAMPAYTFSLPVLDISGLDATERGARYSQIADAELHAPFDLATGPFARAMLVRITADEHVLLFTAHHIAFDGWSTAVFFSELAELYSQFVAAEPAPLSDLPFQYADFAEWQRARIQSPAIDDEVAYWVAHLAGAPSVLELPADHPRLGVRGHAAGSASIVIPAVLAERLRVLGREENATLFMTLFAAFQCLMSRLSGQDDVVAGVPIAGRTDSATEKMLGCFINVLPLRTRISGNSSFRELLRDVRRTVLQGFAHQEVPFDVIVEHMQPERSLSHTPLTQVLFNFRNTPAEMVVFPGLSAEIENVMPASIVSDFTLEIERNADALHCTALYNAELFDRASVERWLGHFLVLLDRAVTGADAPIHSLPLLSEAERQQILIDWNATALEYPKTESLADLVEAQVERSPDAIAVIYGDTAISYRELNARANQLARELVKHGVHEGSIAGLCVERSIDMMIALLAVIKSGGSYLPLDPAYPPARLGYMMADSEMDVLITQRSLLPSVSAFCGPAIQLDADDWKTNSRANLGVAVSGESLAYIIYTSGSTGRPKGVRIPRRALMNVLWSTQQKLQLSTADRWLAIITISFDMAAPEIWLPWIVGATTVVGGRDVAADGDQLRELIAKHDITVLHATPATWSILFLSGWQGKRDLTAMTGGEQLSQQLAARLIESVGPVWNFYGPTETTVWCTAFRVEDPEQPVLIGRPAGNTRCYILDQQHEPQPTGIIGELYVAGDGVAQGYQNNPELTRERFIRDPFDSTGDGRMYRTGDLARYHADGNIECLGRADDQVKLRGFRIELGEIADALRQHSHIRQAEVILREDIPGDRRLVAYVVPGGEMVSTAELREYLKQSLPEYMIPSAYVSLASLPLTPSGKIDRRALPAPHVGVYLQRDRRRPSNAVQDELVRLWQELLNVQFVGITDDFFELGGHSLLAAEMMQRVAAMFGGKPPLSVLFEEPTIQHLARAVTSDVGFLEPRAVCVQHGVTGRTPLFLFHGDYMGGGLYCRKLAGYLDPEQPVYVLAPHQPGGPETIAEMAADMLPHIREIWPHGPYLLAGYCNGGLVAVEVALQLQSVGEAVDLLAVIEVGVRNVQLAWLNSLVNRATGLLGFDQSRQIDTLIRMREPALRFLDEELPRIDQSSTLGARATFSAALVSLLVRRTVRRAWRAALKTVGLRAQDPTPPEPPVGDVSPEDRLRRERGRYISRAMRSYVPRSFSGTITVIRAADGRNGASVDEVRHWQTIATNVTSFRIPGNHTTIVTSDIERLGSLLRAQMPRTNSTGRL
jgi:amino acid adenylation domain-containing protein